MNDSRLQAFKHLLDIMDELREKCPWDSKQTFDSLRYLTIEETYELSDWIGQQMPMTIMWHICVSSSMNVLRMRNSIWKCIVQ